jgi:hypothetical protein
VPGDLGIGRHDAAVGRDRDEVQRAAGHDHRDAGDPTVAPGERAEQPVAEHVNGLVEARRAAGDHRDDEDLDADAGQREPRAADVELGEGG